MSVHTLVVTHKNKFCAKQIFILIMGLLYIYIYMGKMLEDAKNIHSLAVIVLDVFLYNFWRRHNINKRIFPVKDKYLFVLQLKFHTFWINIKVNLLLLKIIYFWRSKNRRFSKIIFKIPPNIFFVFFSIFEIKMVSSFLS